MNTPQAIQTAITLLQPWADRVTQPSPTRVDVALTPAELLPAVSALVEPNWGYLIAITGIDLGVEAGELETLYHFGAGAVVTTLRVRTPRADASLPSVCHLLPYASLYERELIEMFGIAILDTPNPARLFLPDDWPLGVYPLRKDFDPATSAPVEPPYASEPTSGEGKFCVPIGPQHPALKEPGHFEFMVDGEVVTAASIRLGYVHRGIEKAAEERNWIQNLYLFERVCGICSHTHAYAYSLGVEELAQVEAPARAQAIRELVAGLERIHSHLLWVGVAAHEAGFDTLFMYSWRDRETIMDLLEELTGNRVNYSANVLGGVKFDLTAENIRAIHKGIDFLEERMRLYLEVVTTDAAFLQRTRGIGTTPFAQAERLGLVGPTARSSGVLRDVRIDAPYGAYRLYPVSVVTATNGDLEAKFQVRIKELFVTFSAIRTILDNLPEGPLTTRFPRKLPTGEVFARVEAPRGELFYYIKSEGGERPARVKVRTPSICNFGSIIPLVVGHQLADVPMILSGIDPCFSCNDRMVRVRRRETPGGSLFTWNDFTRLAASGRSR